MAMAKKREIFKVDEDALKDMMAYFRLRRPQFIVSVTADDKML